MRDTDSKAYQAAGNRISGGHDEASWKETLTAQQN